jgi:hypothetical protein
LIAFGECNHDECLGNLGQKISADKIIQGAIKKVGDVLLLDIKEVDVASSKVIHRFSKEVPADKPEELLQAADTIAVELTGNY